MSLIMKKLILFFAVFFSVVTVWATPTTWYSVPTAVDPTLLASWYSNTSGTGGSAPTTFATAGDTWIIRSSAMVANTAWNIAGSLQIGNSGTGAVTFNVTPSIGGTVTVNTGGNLLFNGASPFSAAGNVTVSTAGTLGVGASSVVDLGTSYNLYISGTGVCTNNGTIRTAKSGSGIPNYNWTSGNIEYYSTAAQSVSGGSYYNLTLTNTSGVTFTALGNISVNNSLSNGAGIFDLSTYTLGGSLSSLTNSGTIKSSSLSASPFPMGLSWPGTIQYAAAGQKIVGGTYNNLTLSITYGNDTATGNIVVNGGLTVGAGLTFNLVNNSLSGSLSSISNSGTIKTSATSPTVALPSGLTWGGTVTYSNPSGNQIVANGTYNNLTSGNTSGTNSVVASGANTITVNGALNTVSGGTLDFGVNQLLLGGSATISNSGSIATSNTSSTPIPSGKTWGSGAGTVIYNSSTGDQTLVAGNYYNLTNNCSGTITAAGNIAVANSLTNTGTIDMTGSFVISGALNAISNSGTFITSVPTTVSSLPFPTGKNWSASGGTVKYALSTGGQTIVAGVYSSLISANNSGTNTSASPITVNGALTVGNGTLLLQGALTGGSGFSVSNSGTIKTTVQSIYSTSPLPSGKTWGGTVEINGSGNATTLVGGIYNNLTLDNSATASGNVTVNGVLNVVAGRLDFGNYSLSGAFTVTNTGIIQTSATDPSFFPSGKNWGTSGTVTYAAAAQHVQVGTYFNLSLTNSTGYHVASGDLVINNLLTLSTGDTLDMVTSNLSGSLTSATGVVRTKSVSSTPFPTNFNANTVEFYNPTGGQTVVKGVYTNLVISNTSGTDVAGGTIVANRYLTLNTNAVLDNSGDTVYCGTPGFTFSAVQGTGSIIGSGVTYIGGKNTLVYTCSISGVTLPNLYLKNHHFNLTGDLTVTGGLTLDNANIMLGSNNLVLGASASVSHAAGGSFSDSSFIMISGTGSVRKLLSGIGSFLLPVGDNAYNYTPITLNFTSGTFDGSAYASVTLAASKYSANLSTSNYLNRYWSVNTSGISSFTYDVTNASYVPSDVSGSESLMYAAAYSGSTPWIMGAYANSGSHFIAMSGLTGSSEVISGVGYVIPTVTTSIHSTTICSGGSVNVTTTPSGVPPYTYSWSPANGLDATNAASVTASPTITTTYTVTITDPSQNGNTATDTVQVIVNPTPTATVGNSGTICNGGTVNLNATPSGGVTSYSWVGSDATTSNLQNPSFTPTSNTTYSLTVSSGAASGCSPATVYTTAVTVNATPTATVGNSGPICNGGTVSLTATPSGGVASYSWVGSDATSSNLQNPSFTPTSNTTYSLTVSSGAASGCSPVTVYTTAVTVNPTPTATVGNSGTICNGGTVNLTATPSGGVTSYSWVGSDATTSNLQNPSFTPTSNTTYSLTVSSGAASGCSPVTVYTTAVTVNATPTATVGNSGPICNGGTVSLTATPSGGVTSYSWVGSNATTSTLQNPSFTPTSNTTYSLTVSSGAASGCSPVTVYTTAVTVNATPTATVGNSGPICNGGTVNLTATPSGGVTSYSWVGSNATTSTLQNPSFTPTSNTTYSLTVSSGSASGCSPVTVYTTAVTVNAKPTATVGNSGTICNGGTVNLTATPSGGVTSYSWVGSNATSSTLQNPSFTPTSNTTYSLTVSSGAASGCSPATVYTTAVTVNATPTATVSNNGPICSGNTVTLTATPAGGASSYNWSGSNLSASTGVSVHATPTVTSVYSLTVSSGSGSGCSPVTIYTTSVTVLYTPAAITGNSGPICSSGGTTSVTLGNTSGGGTWSSGTTSVATVVSGTGVVTGVAQGTSVIQYSNGCGSAATTTITVYAPPANISSSGSLCSNGATTTLFNTSNGGTWTTGNAAIATIAAIAGTNNALVTDKSTTANGTVIMTYTNVCGSKTYTTYPNISSGTISGASALCTGSALTYTDAFPGGTWVSSNSSVATVSSSGVVTGLTAGTATISYYQGLTCISQAATLPITVNASSGIAAISATTFTICNTTTNGSSITTSLSETTSGGTWSVSSGSLATLNATSGSPVTLTALSAGVPTVTYTIPGGCFVTANVTIGNNPGAISGGNTVCRGSTLTLSDTSVGGTWSTSNVNNATVNSSTGVVYGATIIGSCTITYTVGGCASTTLAITNSASPGTTSGTSSICTPGSSSSYANLTNTSSGGTWSSSNTAIATVSSTTGTTITYFGVAAGTDTISYSFGSCGVAIYPVTVNQLPASINITPSTSFCQNASTTCSSTTTGGTWTTSNSARATVGSSSGIVFGVSAGTDTVTYSLNNGCPTKTLVVTVKPTPGAINSGTNSLIASCTTLTLSDTSSGGTWSRNNSTFGSVSSSGVVSGPSSGVGYTSGGTLIVTYTGTNSCFVTNSVTIVAHPTISLASFTVACGGATKTLTGSPSGGAWTAQNAFATVDGTGKVTGVSAGTDLITYTTATGCFATSTGTISGSGCRGADELGNELNNGEAYVFDLFPNPTSGLLSLQENFYRDEFLNVRIFNYTGASVYDKQTSFKGGVANIDLSSLIPGLYLVQITDSDNVIHVLKVSKQ
jgi:trimeric autotransporter adhesin